MEPSVVVLKHREANVRYRKRNRERCNAAERARYHGSIDVYHARNRVNHYRSYRKNLEVSRIKGRAYTKSSNSKDLEAYRARVRVYNRNWRMAAKMRGDGARFCRCGVPLGLLGPDHYSRVYCWRCKATAREEKLTLKGYPLVRGSGWQVARRAALIRDGFTCRCCGRSKAELAALSKPSTLVVHHIQDWNGAEESNRLSNLVTLCSSCHQRGNVLQVHHFSMVGRRTI